MTTGAIGLAIPTDELLRLAHGEHRLAHGEHHDPHAILGAHSAPGGTVVRAFHPDANAAWLVARSS